MAEQVEHKYLKKKVQILVPEFTSYITLSKLSKLCTSLSEMGENTYLKEL